MPRETPAQARREVLLYTARSLTEDATYDCMVDEKGRDFPVTAARRKAMKKLAADLRERAKENRG